MAEVKWIKLTVGMFDDEKIQLIQSMPEGDAILVIWIRLILLAGKCNCGGYIYFSESIPYTDEMLSTIFHKPLNVVKLAIKTFEQFNMLEIDEKGIYLVNFDKYQNATKLEEIREYNRLAKQKERERKQNLLTADVNDKSMTSQKCQETDIDIDIDKEIEIVEDSQVIALPPIDEIVSKFNEICVSLPKVKMTTDKRKKAIRTRWKKFNDINIYIKVFQKAEASDFLSGRSEKWNGCNFDWLINEANMVKVLEGNYSNKGVNQNGKPSRHSQKSISTE
jgi:predicted phage replisome organizer